VLVVLTGPAARAKGVALAVGFVAGQALFIVVALAVGAATSPDHQNHPGATAVIELLFGAALLATAGHVRRHRRDARPARAPSPRTDAVLARLANLRPSTALGTGAVLGIGGPKRISVTLMVSAAISAAGVRSAIAVGLASVYVALATVLVWLPVLLFVVLGRRATDRLQRVEAWMRRNREPLTFYPSAVLGTLLTVDGIIRLVG
jgi:threonine/homoserine/homoserine lactone efflux protein